MRKFCSQIVLENFFQPCILFLLLEKESYGYELAKRLRETCTCNVNIGNLYRGLNRLVQSKDISKKTVKSEIGPKRVVYQITPKGKLLLKQWIDGLEIQNRAISHLITSYKKIYESNK